MDRNYKAPLAEIVPMETVDVITESIGEDPGTNDGDWTGFVFNRPQSTGKWN